MIRTLLKVRFASLLSTGVNPKTGKPRGRGSKVLTLCLLLFLGLLFGYMVGAFCFLPVIFMAQSGTDYAWLYFTFVAALSFFLCVVGSVFLTITQLYSAKDNELLLSMPVHPRDILLSRMLYLLIMNLALELIVTLPAGLVYAAFLPVSPMGVLCYLLLCLTIPFLALSLSALIGWVVHSISRRMRHKNLAVTLLSLLFVFAYVFLYSMAIDFFSMDEDVIIDSLEKILPVIAGVGVKLFPFNLCGFAIGGRYGYILLFLAFAAALFAVTLYLLSRNFRKVALSTGSVVHVRYREKQLRTTSLFSALLRRELYRFFHSSAYFMNCGIGMVLLLIAIGAIFFVGGDLSAVINSFLEVEEGLPLNGNTIAMSVSIGLMFFMGMTPIAAPSLSLEGKSLWILRSLPISEKKILHAKMVMQQVLTLPVMLLAACAVCYATRPDPLCGIALILCYALLTYLLSAFNAFVGAMLPKFTWLSEAQAVKQGSAGFLATFGGMLLTLLVMIPVLICTLIEFAFVGFFISAFISLAGGFLFQRLLLTVGVAKFKTLV